MNTAEHFYRGGAALAPEPHHYRECGLDNIFLVNGFTREIIDGEEYVAVEDVDGLWKAIGLNLIITRKAFSPKELRYLRNHMRLTQAELAKKLRVSDQTVARWEKGETPLPGPADLALRVLFLLSPIAQPDGQKIVLEMLSVLEKLTEADEVGESVVTFRHGQSAWIEEPIAA